MKFLNLQTGYTFDALWNDTQSRGYIFWFPKEQSIDLTYTMPIAIVATSDNLLSLKIENNDIFSFITSDGMSYDIDGYTFNGQPVYSKTLQIEPNGPNAWEKISDNKYVHVFNVACSSKNAGEYICKINIGDNGYIRVGADFYGEHEPIYINLSNMGVEIPSSVQKAIYDANVHEDMTDNILVNRKFKELMSNYWDIIANKGSYKSLLNALEWFEWEDQLRIREVYRHAEANKMFFNDKDIATTVNHYIENEFTNFIKTTYISLSCLLQNELAEYDEELNPKLEQAVFKWSINDIKLKIALFAKFFGVHFLPMHLSVLHATAEDTVFTNTIKAINGKSCKRVDCIGSFDFVESNIKDNSVFTITNVRAQVTNNTVFGIRFPESERKKYKEILESETASDTEKQNAEEALKKLIHDAEKMSFGVDVFPSDGLVTEQDESIKTFGTQYYTGPGAIIPINIIIPNINAKDFIKQTNIDYTDELNNTKQITFNTIFKPEADTNTININFNFLAKAAKKYSIIFTFFLASSKTITKRLNFTVEDIDNVNINIYKVQAKNDSNGLTRDDFYSNENNKYFFKIQKDYEPISKSSYYIQYLPFINIKPTDKNYNSYNGIKRNKTIVLDCTRSKKWDEWDKWYRNDIYKKFLPELEKFGFLYFVHVDRPLEDTTGYKKIKYITLICKYFNTNEPTSKLIKYLRDNKYIDVGIENPMVLGAKYDYDTNPNYFKIIKNEYVFYNQFHNLIKMDGNNIDNYTISQYEAICCAVEINNENETIDFKYGIDIKDSEWTFYNHLTNTKTTLPVSCQQPFIANSNTKKVMDKGYYDITFKYSLNNGITNECKLNSAFRIKN